MSINEPSDLVFVHFALHDIPAAERPVVVRHLARVLADKARTSKLPEIPAILR